MSMPAGKSDPQPQGSPVEEPGVVAEELMEKNMWALVKKDGDLKENVT